MGVLEIFVHCSRLHLPGGSVSFPQIRLELHLIVSDKTAARKKEVGVHPGACRSPVGTYSCRLMTDPVRLNSLLSIYAG